MEWTRGPVIGRGSMATVSLATAIPSGELFAVKSSELSKSMFLQKEQQFLSRMSCSHIVKYLGFDVREENKTPTYNLFLEYMSEGSLYDLIQRHGGRIEEPMIRSCTHQVVQGLDYLHSIGVLHCDIKSQNILVAKDGVKIADLGCAKLVEKFKQSEIGCLGISGTPAFMSPEVARGEEQGFLADVWALGCTIIEMATGNSPWPSVNDPISALYKIGFSNDAPEVPRWLSEEAKDFVSKCLMRNPKERWSAKELLKHPFLLDYEFDHLSEEKEIKMKSPSSVLDQGLWDSLDVQGSPHEKDFSLKSPEERVKRLVEGSVSPVSKEPDWTWHQDWVTVRSRFIEEKQKNSSFRNEVLCSSSSEGELSCLLDDDDDDPILLEFYVNGLNDISNISFEILRSYEDMDDLVPITSYFPIKSNSFSFLKNILSHYIHSRF